MKGSSRFTLFLSFILLCTLLAGGCGRDVTTDPSGVPSAGVIPMSQQNAYPPLITFGWQPEGDYILSLDTQTGLGTLGPPFDWGTAYGSFGLTFDLDGTCYAFMAFHNGGNASYLARVDTETGVTTPINQNAPYDLIFAGPDIDSRGNLFVTGFTVGPPEDPENPAWWGGYDLWRVDKGTGALTLVGDTRVGTGGEFAGEWMDLAFDSQDRCWTTCRNKLFLLDTTDGHVTFMTDITGVPTEFIPDDECPEDWKYMEVMDIAFDENDVLWASAIRGFSPCVGFKNAPVMRIDVNTGEGTVVGYAYTGGQNHGGDIMPTKVKVCHVARRGAKYIPIEIAITDLADHRAHGDVVPGVDFPGCDCPADATGRPGDFTVGQ